MIKIPNPYEMDSATEWTAAAYVMENLVNRIIDEKHLELGPARVEMRGVDGKRPDGVIYADHQCTRSLINIEFKQPFFDPFDFENLKEPAWRKAVKRKAPYFGTCNFRELVVFNTEKVNKNLPEEQQIVGKYHLSDIFDLDLIKETNIQLLFKKTLEKSLEELLGDWTGEKSLPLLPLDEFLIYRLHEKIKILSLYYKETIMESSHEPTFAKKLALWFVDQNWSFTYQNEDYEKAARQAAYLLVNKILFYDVLRAKKPELNKLEIPESLTQGQILHKTLQAYFEEVLKIDYQTIYSTDFIDEMAFPDNKEVVYHIKELIKILERFDFSSLGYEVIGRIFEKLIPSNERHILGQYFTNPDVVDIILKFCLRHENDKILDPACGAGTFLVRAYQHKKIMNQTLTHEEILKTLWGNDIAKFPAHLTTINLAINDLSSNENYPRVIQKDFFEWLGNHKDIIEIPESSRKVFLKTLSSEEKQEVVPRYFDCLVGNPPYTRQEEISDLSGEDKGYKENLIASALKDVDGKDIANISKRAGLHAYFFVHGIKFLQNGGRFGFVVSNSWLDVDYGKGLQEFFLNNYKIVAVIESKVERWFEEAGINTCIVLLEKASGKDKKLEREENLVKFVYLKRPLRAFIPSAADLWQAQVERLESVEKLLRTIYAHNDFYENEDLRIYPKSQKGLWEEGFNEETQKYEGAKWGKYLRAPQIFFKILEKAEDKLTPLKTIADVRRGFTTGANEFFYLTEEEIKRRKIEKEFWMHKDEEGHWIPNRVITSPREGITISIKPEGLKQRVLLIHEDKIHLRGTKILEYIKDGERKGFDKNETCSTRRLWYDLGQRKAYGFLHPMIHNDRQAIFINEFGSYVDHNLFEIQPHDDRSLIPLALFFVSTISLLFKELYGRINLGEGALKTEGADIQKLPILNIASLNDDYIKKLLEWYESNGDFQILSIFKDLGTNNTDKFDLDSVNPSRRRLDKIIMEEMIGLTEKEQIEVYKSVIDLAKSRLDRAKSVKKEKTTKSGFNLDLMVKTILDKADTQSLGSFYKKYILSKKPLEKVKLPKLAAPLKLEKTLLDYRLTSGRESIDCSSEEEGRYLRIFLEAGWDEVQVPNSEIIKEVLPSMEKIVSKTKTALTYYTDSILDTKLKDQIKHAVWQATS